MGIPALVLFFMAMLVLALLAEPVARRLRIPFTALLVLVGFVASELLVMAGADTGLRWQGFHDIVLYVLLPILIFESALNLDARVFFRNLIPVLLLAIPLMMLSAGITAAVLYYGIGHSAGFPWVAALMTGTILAATDPVAVIDLFRKAGLPERLVVLVEGESLLNDATAIVLFMLFMSMAIVDGSSITVSDGAIRFAAVFFGGAFVGAAAGLASVWLVKRLRNNILRGVLSLVGAYVTFLLAEGLHLSGVMAVLVTGMFYGAAIQRYPEAGESTNFVSDLWSFNAYIANALIFLLVGVTVHTGMFVERWLAMVLGIVAVLVARAIGVFGVIPLVSRLPGVEKIEPGYQVCIYWGGLRGAVALALALSLPVELDYWYTIQSIAYGVVLFTLFVQAPTMPVVLKRVF